MPRYNEWTISLKTLLQHVWSKYKPFLNQYAETFSWKVVYGWMDNITKNERMLRINTKTILSKISTCCRCSLPSWLLVGCSCKIQACWSGANVTTITTIPVWYTKMVGYYYNKYECWFSASVSDMYACRCKFNRHDCWLSATVKDMTNGQSHGWWPGANVVYMNAYKMKL